ncbi:UNVERIFIED_CONTAM: Spliceosome-associated protein A [Sesamum radiatum]|uniref:Spliceosome-associated protein A n=1 Tax=Sesamum radiatum TaxID=300843 RepID=A0AAW2M069_SESRA
MYLYSLTLQQATGILCAINGSFSGGKSQEIVVARGKVLDLLRPDENGKLQSLLIVPGQYLAIDPKGRAVMIGACEKQKLVYVLNRDTAARLTISSPLEAHKSHTLVYSICGVDCGFDNPIFAAIELDYSEADQDPTGQAANEAQKHLTFYELDLGLNHVSRKWSEQVDNG